MEHTISQFKQLLGSSNIRRNRDIGLFGFCNLKQSLDERVWMVFCAGAIRQSRFGGHFQVSINSFTFNYQQISFLKEI